MSKIIGEWGPPPKARTKAKAKAARTDMITARLDPGERLLWSGRGYGHPSNASHPGVADLLDVFFFFGVAILLAVAVISTLVSTYSTYLGVTVGGIGLGLLVVRAIWGHGAKIYGLTVRRIIVADRMMPGFSASYWLKDMGVIETTGGKNRGDVKFGFVSLVGVQQPAELANLIKSQKIGLVVHNKTR